MRLESSGPFEPESHRGSWAPPPPSERRRSAQRLSTYMSPPENPARHGSTPRTTSSTDERPRPNYTQSNAGMQPRDYVSGPQDSEEFTQDVPGLYKPPFVGQSHVTAPSERSTSIPTSGFHLHAALSRPEPATATVVSPTTTSADGPAIDGMGLLLAPERTTPRSSGLPGGSLGWGASPEGEVFGDLSGISFHRLLLDTLLPGYGCMAPGMNDQAASSTEHYDGGDRDEVGFLGMGPLPDMFYVRPDDLPPLSQARVMIDYFQSHTWQIYPFVDIASLKSTYEQLLDSATEYSHRNGIDSSRPLVDPLRLPRNQPIIALHFIVFALVQSISETPFTRIDGG